MSDVEKGAATANASQATVAQAEVYPVVPAPRPSRIADPTPLGLFSFASTLLVLSFYNAHTRHVSTPNVVVGMALFYGGLAQLLAGMWSFAIGSQLGATAFSTYGGFWMSYAALQIPNSGIVAAYEADPAMLSQAIGIMLIVFMILSFFFAIASLRVNIMFVIVFAHIVMVFACLAASQFTSSTGLQKAGGWFGIIASFLSFYCGVALMLAPLGVMDLPLGSTARKSV